MANFFDQFEPKNEGNFFDQFEPKKTADQVNVNAKGDEQKVGAPLAYSAFGYNTDRPAQGKPGQPSYMPSTKDYDARNMDAARSVLNIPRDIVEDTVALPRIVDDFEKTQTDKLKSYGPDDVRGRLGANLQWFADQTPDAKTFLPTKEQVQSITSPVLNEMTNGLVNKPYESKTALGEGLRVGGSILLSGLKPAAEVGEVKPLMTVDEAYSKAGNAYADAERLAPDVWPSQYNKMAVAVKKAAKENGVNIDSHPQTTKVVNRIAEGIQNGPPSEEVQWYQAMGGKAPKQPEPVTFKEVEQMRQDLNKVARNSFGSQESYQAGQVKEVLDQALRNVGASSPHYERARQAYQTFKRMESLDNLVEDARDLARTKGMDEMQTIQDKLFQKMQRQTKSDRMWMNQFTPEMQTKLREAATQPKKLQGFLGMLSKDRSLLVGATTYAATGGNTAAAAGAASAARTTAAVAKAAQRRLGGMSVKQLTNIQRQAQGLKTIERHPLEFLDPATWLSISTPRSER